MALILYPLLYVLRWESRHCCDLFVSLEFPAWQWSRPRSAADVSATGVKTVRCGCVSCVLPGCVSCVLKSWPPFPPLEELLMWNNTGIVGELLSGHNGGTVSTFFANGMVRICSFKLSQSPTNHGANEVANGHMAKDVVLELVLRCSVWVPYQLQTKHRTVLHTSFGFVLQDRNTCSQPQPGEQPPVEDSKYLILLWWLKIIDGCYYFQGMRCVTATLSFESSLFVGVPEGNSFEWSCGWERVRFWPFPLAGCGCGLLVKQNRWNDTNDQPTCRWLVVLQIT